jgi:hypothetical protein
MKAIAYFIQLLRRIFINVQIIDMSSGYDQARIFKIGRMTGENVYRVVCELWSYGEARSFNSVAFQRVRHYAGSAGASMSRAICIGTRRFGSNVLIEPAWPNSVPREAGYAAPRASAQLARSADSAADRCDHEQQCRTMQFGFANSR